MTSLHKFKMAMNPIPEHMARALQQGVIAGDFPDIGHAAVVFADWPRYRDRVMRAENGCALVTCTTALPHVSPAMVDWWFGWHLPYSERYQLWHPLAHRVAKVKEDRQHMDDDRARYVGNVSYVDEWIGKRMMRLAISFVSPEAFGLVDIDQLGATAICATTTDRLLRSEGGFLIHLVVPTATGSEMRSAFWLGQVTPHWPMIHGLITPLLNRAAVRKLIVSDRMCVDLLQHCAEEMNHLARFLPDLYAEVHG